MPRFVQFASPGGHPIAVNPDRITGVEAAGDETKIYDGSEKPFTVREGFDEVIRKLTSSGMRDVRAPRES